MIQFCEFINDPQIRFSMGLKEFDLMLDAGRGHYDYEVKQAVKEDGWLHQLRIEKWGTQKHGGNHYFVLSFGQVDLMNKICESFQYSTNPQTMQLMGEAFTLMLKGHQTEYKRINQKDYVG